MRTTPSLRLKVLLEIAALAMIAGCSFSQEQAEMDARETATGFLNALRAGQIESAWQGTTTEFKSLMGLENLRDYVIAYPALKAPAEFASLAPIERNGRTYSECAFHSTAKVRGKPMEATIRILLTKESDGWKVEKLTVD